MNKFNLLKQKQYYFDVQNFEKERKGKKKDSIKKKKFNLQFFGTCAK